MKPVNGLGHLAAARLRTAAALRKSASGSSAALQTLRLALPAAGEQMLGMMVGIVDTFLVGHIGAAALAAVGLANQWVMLTNALFGAIGVGSTALIARSVGAKDSLLANRVLRQSVLVGAALMGLMGVVFILFPLPLVSFFTSDPQVIALGTGPLRIVGLAQPALAATMIINGALRGAGDTRYPLYIVAGCIWGIRVPLAILFITVMGLGLEWAWVAMSVDLFFRGLFAFLRYRGGKWKSIQV
jgi:Na+-driven multidrug efflux pump